MQQQINKANQKGFTLIEVVLVLAIAGLIFLLVFLALPALQRSQRDTARKNDISRFISQLSNYQSNTQGNVPAANVAAWNSFVSSYLTSGGQQFGDPDTGSYALNVVTTAGTAPSSTRGTLTIYEPAGGARCDTTLADGVAAGSGGRQVAVVIPLEQGGFYCAEN